MNNIASRRQCKISKPIRHGLDRLFDNVCWIVISSQDQPNKESDEVKMSWTLATDCAKRYHGQIVHEDDMKKFSH